MATDHQHDFKPGKFFGPALLSCACGAFSTPSGSANSGTSLDCVACADSGGGHPCTHSSPHIGCDCDVHKVKTESAPPQNEDSVTTTAHGTYTTKRVGPAKYSLHFASHAGHDHKEYTHTETYGGKQVPMEPMTSRTAKEVIKSHDAVLSHDCPKPEPSEPKHESVNESRDTQFNQGLALLKGAKKRTRGFDAAASPSQEAVRWEPESLTEGMYLGEAHAKFGNDHLNLSVQTNPHPGAALATAHWKASQFAGVGHKSYTLSGFHHTDYAGNPADHETGYAHFTVAYLRNKSGTHPINKSAPYPEAPKTTCSKECADSRHLGPSHKNESTIICEAKGGDRCVDCGITTNDEVADLITDARGRTQCRHPFRCSQRSDNDRKESRRKKQNEPVDESGWHDHSDHNHVQCMQALEYYPNQKCGKCGKDATHIHRSEQQWPTCDDHFDLTKGPQKKQNESCLDEASRDRAHQFVVAMYPGTSIATVVTSSDGDWGYYRSEVHLPEGIKVVTSAVATIGNRIRLTEDYTTDWPNNDNPKWWKEPDFDSPRCVKCNQPVHTGATKAEDDYVRSDAKPVNGIHGAFVHNHCLDGKKNEAILPTCYNCGEQATGEWRNATGTYYSCGRRACDREAKSRSKRPDYPTDAKGTILSTKPRNEDLLEARMRRLRRGEYGSVPHGDDDDSFSSYKNREEGQCPNCGGASTELGTLGRTKHYRCVECGQGHSSELGEAKAAPDGPHQFRSKDHCAACAKSFANAYTSENPDMDRLSKPSKENDPFRPPKLSQVEKEALADVNHMDDVPYVSPFRKKPVA